MTFQNSALESLDSDSVGLSRQGSFRQTEGFYAQQVRISKYKCTVIKLVSSSQVRTYHSADCTPMLQRSFSATPRRRKSAAVTPHR